MASKETEPYFKKLTKNTKNIFNNRKIQAILAPPDHWAVIGTVSLIFASIFLQETHSSHQEPHHEETGSLEGMMVFLGLASFIGLYAGAIHLRNCDMVRKQHGWIGNAVASSVLLVISSLLFCIRSNKSGAAFLVELCVTVSLFSVIQIIRPRTDFGLFNLVARLPVNTAWKKYRFKAKALWTFFGILGLTWLKHWLDEEIELDEATHEKKTKNKNGKRRTKKIKSGLDGQTERISHRSGHDVDVESNVKPSGPVFRNVKIYLVTKYPVLWGLLGFGANLLSVYFMAKTHFANGKNWLKLTALIVGSILFVMSTWTAQYVREWKFMNCKYEWWVQGLLSTVLLIFVSFVGYNGEDTIASYWAEVSFTLAVFSLIQILRPGTDLNLLSYFARMPVNTAWRLFGFGWWGLLTFVGALIVTWLHFWLIKPKPLGKVDE